MEMIFEWEPGKRMEVFVFDHMEQVEKFRDAVERRSHCH